MGFPKYEREDYGQTLGAWGVGPGCYLVLPILGPSTIRDTAGSFANALGGENRNLSNHRVWADSFARKAVQAGMPKDSVDAFKDSITENLPRVDEDTMPGELERSNDVAGNMLLNRCSSKPAASATVSSIKAKARL